METLLESSIPKILRYALDDSSQNIQVQQCVISNDIITLSMAVSQSPLAIYCSGYSLQIFYVNFCYSMVTLHV